MANLRVRLARRAAPLVAALALPVSAAAQGDESLFVPTGNVVGMFWVFVTVFVVKATARVRALAIMLASAAAILPHLAPEPWLASWPGDYPRAAFMLGFLPPLCAAAAVLLIDRRRAR